MAKMFCLSSALHGLQHTEPAVPLAQEQLLHVHLCAAIAGAALPSRYHTRSAPGFQLQQRGEVPKQAFGFAPLFRLSRNTSLAALKTAEPATSSSSTSSNSSDGAASLALYGSMLVAVRAPAGHAAMAATPAAPPQHRRPQQQQQQRPSGSMPPPWLGAALDVGGYTKKGWMQGGGKEQNQDRGLILEAFRGPSELLLGVMDGHGANGHLVSTFLTQHLPAVLLRRLVEAAAALGAAGGSGGGEEGEPASKQRRLFGLVGGGKQEQQQQQQWQRQQEQQDVGALVPYVVMADHLPAYGPWQDEGRSSGSSSAGESSSSNSSSSSSSSSSREPVQGSGRGRVVAKEQLVRRPHDGQQQQQQQHGQLSSGTATSSSTSSGSDLPPQQQRVPHAALSKVSLSQGLLSAAFAETDWLLSGSGINVLDSGSTALLCAVGPRSITTAWVGDTRAVLGRRTAPGQRRAQAAGAAAGSSSSSSSSDSSSSSSGSSRWRQQLRQLDILNSSGAGLAGEQQQQQHSGEWVVVPLSDDHKPERPDECLRITLNDGRVQQLFGRGPYRVWFKGIDYPGLAMSRAFGDTPCRRIGVTVEPEVTVTHLTPADELLVAASDGVWDVLTNEEAVGLAGAAPSAAAAARALVEVAEARWLGSEGGHYVDDITAIVVKATPRA